GRNRKAVGQGRHQQSRSVPALSKGALLLGKANTRDAAKGQRLLQSGNRKRSELRVGLRGAGGLLQRSARLCPSIGQRNGPKGPCRSAEGAGYRRYSGGGPRNLGFCQPQLVELERSRPGIQACAGIKSELCQCTQVILTLSLVFAVQCVRSCRCNGRRGA